MTYEQKYLLNLLQYSFNNQRHQDVGLLDVDWIALFEESTRQGVCALVLDALSKSPVERHPPKVLLLQWIGLVATMERMYGKYCKKISSLAKFYKEHDLHLMILKGYGCSLCWNTPRYRPVGDIDIYLFGKQERADALVERELSIKVHREYHKHSTFDYYGVEVENHAKFMDNVSHKSNIRFEQTLVSLLCEASCLKSPIDNVLLPPPTFNALFLLRHTGEHFASNEITLRHVLDVGSFFQKYHSLIDWKLMKTAYQQERMVNFFNGIATICVEYLGLGVECFQSPDKRYTYHHHIELADRILTDIFEKKDTLPMSMAGVNTIGQKLKYAMNKTRRWWKNRWKYQLVYNENVVESFWWLARNRMNI